MYRQGLGDCFLLTFPKRKGESHVLIDCGVLTGTEEAQKRMETIAQNILKTTNRQLDALVVTHEHWDHVSGFLQAEKIFNELKVSEVWLAWTENPKDDFAEDLRARKTKALKAIDTVQRKLRNVEGVDGARLNALMAFHGDLGVNGRKTTGKAMDWVKSRNGARLRFFKPGDEPFGLRNTETFRVYALGPPRTPKMLKKINPSQKTSEVYELAGEDGAELGFFAAVQSLEAGAAAREQPFDKWFRVTEDEARREPFFATRYSKTEKWRQVEHDWLGAADSLALQLDSYTNNTCLALAFELCDSGRVLLFPGDAQVGSWLSWEGLEWKVAQGRKAKTVTTRSLLERTVLYKVGHHGSHNATLREKGLELMLSDELTAMIPVNRVMAKKMEWNMPFPSLLRRLHEKTRGRILDGDEGVKGDNPGMLSDREWKQFVARTDVQEHWVDYRVPL